MNVLREESLLHFAQELDRKAKLVGRKKQRLYFFVLSIRSSSRQGNNHIPI
jgi:hypothetical protein